MTWRCAGPMGCQATLGGGTHGPYLDAVVSHLRTAHPDRSFDDAWESFRHAADDERTPVDSPRAQVGTFHPDTAHEAARKALGRSGSDRRRVYDLAVARGERGVTDDEIEVELGLPHQTASARRNGLRDDGWLRDSGRKRPTRTGSDATVWAAVL